LAIRAIRDRIFFYLVIPSVFCTAGLAQSHPMASTSGGMTGVATPTPYGNQPSGDPNSEANALNRQLVKDQGFIRKLMESGNVDAKLGELAQQNSQNDDIKRAGKKIVEDHIKLNIQLEPAATELGIAPSKELSRKDQQLIAKFEALNGTKFDEEYIKVMVKEHQQALKDLNAEAKASKIATVTDAAKGGQSIITQDLQMIEQIAQGHDLTSESKSKKASSN